MKKLVEMIGKKEGYSTIDIYNQYELISKNIEKLVDADVKFDTDTIILTSIKYSLSLKLQMEYKNILNYVQENL